MMSCALAMSDVLDWMGQNPVKAGIIENAVRDCLTKHGLQENGFNSRSADQNFQAIDRAGYKAPIMGGDLEEPPPATLDGLHALVKSIPP